MSAEADTDNVSAASFAWLSRELVLTGVENVSPALQRWREVREGMRKAPGGQFLDSAHWPSDPWIARNTTRTFLGEVFPVWDPPEQLDEWPTLGVHGVIASIAPVAIRTNHETFTRLLADARLPVVSGDGTSLDRLATMEAGVRQDGDVNYKQIEQVRAWLSTALGPMFMDVPLTQDLPLDGLVTLARERLAQSRALEPWSPIVEFEDRQVEIVYSTRVSAAGGNVAFESTNVRSGQSQWWREYWAWLSSDIEAQAMLEAIKVAAGLMCCPPLLYVFGEALRSDDAALATLALAVLRRWLLTLKAMAWLEAALARQWTEVRPQDLACFAFNAVKPEWPRRILAVSHRSSDAKPTLVGMQLWGSARCAIDANYVPAWETNTAMVWGLFAATPAIARIRSVGYQKSAWCRREIELTQYLVDESDFLAERWVIDVQLSQLRGIDRIAVVWDDQEPASQAAPDRHANLIGEFPPPTQLWRLPVLPAWEANMLRAGAALRLINSKASNPDLTNRVAALLALGGDADQLPAPPTNNSGGWIEYAAILRAAGPKDSSGGPPLAVLLPSAYSDRDRARDEDLSKLIPDWSAVELSLGDVLLALEWLRVEWPFMATRGLGENLLVDCQPLSREQWKRLDVLSLHRGLVALRKLPVPLWILQDAGQEVEHWPCVGEHPIFTQHVPMQFKWMMAENRVDRAHAQRRYPDASGLVLAPELLARCRGETTLGHGH